MKLAGTLITTVALLSPTNLGFTVASDAAHELPATSLDPREYVQARASRSGWIGREWRCLDALVYRESRWHNSKNPRSSARGYFQLLRLPARTPLAKQYERFERYINTRYGTPCAALRFRTNHNYY